MVRDDVAVCALSLEVGVVISGAEREFPKTLATRIMSRREKDFVVFSPEECMFLDLHKFLPRLFDGKFFGFVGLTKISDRTDEAAW